MPTLREIRKASPYKLQEIADYMMVSTRTIQLWEKGIAPITMNNLERLLLFLEVDLETIRMSDFESLIPRKLIL